jgi:protoporphyrinogen oxidase
MNIAIIGGGFTGLTCAYRLLQKGHKVVLYEAGESVGGLASGFKINGTNLEKTYHHIFRTDADIIDLTKELGVIDNLQWLDSSVSNYSKGAIYPFSSPNDLLTFKPLPFFDRIRLGLVTLFLKFTHSWKPFIKITAYDWMKKFAGKNATSVIWEPLLKGKFTEKYYKKVSMSWLWARLHTRIGARSKEDIKNEHLGYYRGGFDVLVEALKVKIVDLGGQILTSTKITGIDDQKNGQVELYFAENKKSFDKVLVTTPSSIFASLIKSQTSEILNYKEKLNSVDYIGAICLIFTSSQDLSKYYWHNILDTKFPFLVFINHTKLTPKKWYKNENVYYLGAYSPHDSDLFNSSEEEIKSLWFEYLSKIFPDFDQAKITQEFLFKFRNAQHVVDTDYISKIPDYKTPLQNVYLSNFSQIFPEDRGTNFAVREGNKIAEIILS